MRLCQMIHDLKEAEEFLPIDYFTVKYEVSKRTIQSDIAYLTNISSQKGFCLHMKRGSGYLIEVCDHNTFAVFLHSLSSNKVLVAKDRITNIVALLLLQDNYISMEVIADTFEVSKSLIKLEMKKVASIFENAHLTLRKKAHYGILLEGEQVHRKALILAIYAQGNDLLAQHIDQAVARGDFQSIETAFIRKLEKENLNINYHELKNVSVWLKVTIYLARKKVQSNAIIDTEEESAYQRIAYHIVTLISKTYAFQWSTQDMAQFINLLQKNVRMKEPVRSFSKDLKANIDHFLAEIDTQYQTNFQSDYDFKTLLLTHVSLLIDRLHQKISYKNMMIEEICIKYPMIFNFAIKFCDILKQQYQIDITHDEVGFVATHFAVHMEKESSYKMRRFSKIAVVCSSGGGSAILIKLQIESLFHSSQVETFSLLEMDMLRNYQPDLIFTIMELDQPVDAPIIYIKELLDDMDLLRIQQVLRFDNYNSFSLIEQQVPFYCTLFHRDFFQVIKAQDYQNIIQDMAGRIEEKGYGGEHYLAYVLERESYLSTIYMNGVSIPHPIQMSAKKNLISVCILEESLVYEGSTVSLIFMIALTKEDFEIHKDITKKLYQLMQDIPRVERMKKVRSLKELIVIMKELDGGTI